MKKTIVKILELSYGKLKPKYRTKVELIIKKLEGGDFLSPAIRRIFKKHYNIEVGIATYGCFDRLKFFGPIKIGNYCSIAKGVRFLNGNHPKNFVSTHPYFYNKDFNFVKEDKIIRKKFEVGHDVWIGNNALILPGVTKIGTGAIIGAGAIVTKDVEEYSIIVGCPAKKIESRFPEDICKKIKQTKWFELHPSQLKEKALLFENPELFLSKFNTP